MEAKKEEGRKVLVFRLDTMDFAVPLLKVVEIAEMPPLTPVPQSSKDLLGLSTVRGRLVPVLDLRRRFGMQDGPTTRETCLLVVEAHLGDDSVPVAVGWRVDRVLDVVYLPLEAISPPPFAAGVDLAFLGGMATWRDGKLLLLDPEKTLETTGGVGLEALQRTLDSGASAPVPASS